MARARSISGFDASTSVAIAVALRFVAGLGVALGGACNSTTAPPNADAAAGSGGLTGGGGATGLGGNGAGAGGGPGSGDAGTPNDAAAGGAMTFFVSSTGSGTSGGNLGGLAAADAKCQSLAAAVNLGGKVWRAYLSTSGGVPVNARDRIGSGPWRNANGVVIASGLAQLHDEGGTTNLLNAANSLDERGNTVPTNQHDVLTGSTTTGMALPATPDRTCADWTSGAAGTAQVGHENRAGGGDIPTSWNSAHSTPTCSQASITQVGGAGRLYCFAVN